jgi:hypothetical protein
MRRRLWPALWGVLALGLSLCGPAAARAAEAEAPEWRLEQPRLPGVSWLVPLGGVGDIEFLEGAPNRGLLITAGNGSAVEPGVWTYDGQGWHELSNQCGAAKGGRIAWAGPDEFWTISDGRPGQAGESLGTQFEKNVPLSDNTLCHFQNGQIAASYAHPAFEADSYQVMRGAACVGPSDCWFGGDPLPEPRIGAFHLRWNGAALEEEPYPAEGYPVYDMRALGNHIYESAQIEPQDRSEREVAIPPVLHVINPPGVIPTFEPEEEAGAGLPFYEPGESAQALAAMHLSAADGIVWAAAGPLVRGTSAQLTVAVREGGGWRLVIGPSSHAGVQLEHILPPAESAEEEAVLGGPVREAMVTAIAAEPGTDSAWIGLAAHGERAVLVHVDSHGNLLGERTFPSAEERAAGVGDKGEAASLACPAQNDCWLATTQGWLYHLAMAGERTLPANGDPAFEHLISFRPRDQGLPQVAPDAPPEDISGLLERGILQTGQPVEAPLRKEENRVTLPLLSGVHTRLRGTTLEMTFKLSVKARVRLLAKRKAQTIASTPMRTFKAGKRALVLKLDPHRWPTKLVLQTHALQPLRSVSSVTGEGVNVNSETTGLSVSPFAQGARPGLLP